MSLVILCDEQGRELGEYGKLQAHLENKLHKAFSIVIYNRIGQMLIHQRAASKYHSPGIWTNACCSHHVPGVSVLQTAPQRLQEEMGFTTELQELFTFVYQVDLGGIYEHERDTVFCGQYDGPIDIFNPDEVQDARWVYVNDLMCEMEKHPERFSPWFKIILGRLMYGEGVCAR